jgi:hypothetical protein
MSAPMHVRREQRLARTLARRGTPEWQAGGRELVAEQARTEALVAEQRRVERALAAERRRQQAPVTDAELAKACRQVHAAIEEAAADTGLPADTVAWDIVQGQVAYMREALAAEVRRVLL